MAFEWWWLLILPLLFLLGWLAGHLDKRHSQREQEALPRAYFRALNHLLNNEFDLAADAFIEVVKLKPEMVELHLALGNLFRQRGEPDRALRVHQNLLDRPDLSALQREHAQYELGQDFIKAGLLDRAETCMLALQESHYAVPAKRALMQIYQSTRDYARALEMGLSIAAQGDASASASTPESPRYSQLRLSHLACELLEQAWATLSPAQRQEKITLAQQLAPDSARPWLIQARQSAEQGQWPDVLAAWKKLVQLTPQLLTLLPREWQHWQRLPGFDAAPVQATWATQLVEWQQTYHYVELLDLMLRHPLLQEQQAALIQAALASKPSAAQILRILQAQLPGMTAAGSEAVSTLLPRCIEALAKEAQRQPQYVCSHCGFKSVRHYWQCPGCQHWDTLASAQ
ncbi:hypothetical protein [Parvibium lacunae]|uniref:LapB rubredoxin metal binding domain-containing protein n=1 Tax=Parvibium lacunae TaxID=1888893 RepID=A0A368L4K2_9BURK|nr:hypothetical protein [Parvibium lacunae]RCS58504.1 hypothetical protein DU000_06765 [Parvibium lacunae]